MKKLLIIALVACGFVASSSIHADAQGTALNASFKEKIESFRKRAADYEAKLDSFKAKLDEAVASGDQTKIDRVRKDIQTKRAQFKKFLAKKRESFTKMHDSLKAKWEKARARFEATGKVRDQKRIAAYEKRAQILRQKIAQINTRLAQIGEAPIRIPGSARHQQRVQERAARRQTRQNYMPTQPVSRPVTLETAQ